MLQRVAPNGSNVYCVCTAPELLIKTGALPSACGSPARAKLPPTLVRWPAASYGVREVADGIAVQGVREAGEMTRVVEVSATRYMALS